MNASMKAAICTTYGPPEVLKIETVEKPSLLDGGEDRVVVQVHSAAVNPWDYHHRNGYWVIRLMNGLVKPQKQILGIDVAGVIESVGKGVTKFKAGDRVFGSCVGSHAEYVRPRQTSLSRMPANLTFSEAAAIPCAAQTALQALRDVAQIKPGHKVLITGASGGVGHFAVQLASYFGAEVTAVCSTPNLSWVKDLGAQHVIDYTREDFTQNGQQYDLIFDAAVRQRTFFSSKRSLTATGVYIPQAFKPRRQMPQVLLSLLVRDKQLRLQGTKPNDRDLDFIRDLVEAGKIRPVIEKRFPLDQIVAAHRHVEKGHTKGKIVIEVRNGHIGSN